MTSSTLSTFDRPAALRSVSTIGAALREVIVCEDEHGRALLTELSTEEIEAIVPALTRTLGLLVGVESMRKAAKPGGAS